MDELIEYIGLPSRSSRKEEVLICGKQALKLLQSCGLDVKSLKSKGNNVLYGESIAGEDFPTILIYGHYDVQPEGDLSQWSSPPFQPEVRGNKLFGRGTADNKGQHFAHILALRYLRENNPDLFQRLNIKIILDGDEELGSYSLPEVIRENTELLSCDFIYVSDGPSLSTDRPTVVCSVRGILDFQLVVQHNQSDLHSGNFGGVARSAILDLMKLLNSMVAADGEVLIDGFYDRVNTPLQEELDALHQMDTTYEKIISEYKLTKAPSYRDMDNKSMNQLSPNFNINGIKSGGVGAKRRTIIPSEATASIDIRIVPDMSPERLKEIITRHVKQRSEDMGISDAVYLEFGHPMNPIYSSIQSKYMDLVKAATREGFGIDPMIVPRLGGSLPIYLFPKYLKSSVILVPLSHPDSRNHAPDENLDIPYFESGVVTMVSLLTRLVTN